MYGNILGDRLKNLRKGMDLTQQELANKLGISTSTIGMYEQGRREPDGNTLTKLSNIFNVSIDYLIRTDEDEKESKEVTRMLTEFTNELSRYDGLMFDGKNVSDDEKQKLIDAIKIAAKIAVNNE